MKKSLRLIIPVVIVIALVISTALAFTLTGGAADAEATLSTRTVTFSSTGYVNGLGTATTTEGGFAELAAGFSSLAPTEATRYYLKLNSNVTLESPITIATTELVEVIIDLGGHTDPAYKHTLHPDIKISELFHFLQCQPVCRWW